MWKKLTFKKYGLLRKNGKKHFLQYIYLWKFSFNSARTGLTGWFWLRFPYLYSYIISVFQFFSSFKTYGWFSTILPIFVQKSIRKSIKIIFPDVFQESVMCLGGGFLHEWLFTHDTIVFPPELKKWPAELGYKATSLANTNNADLFSSQGISIRNKYFIPALYRSPAFESEIHRRLSVKC